MIALCGTLRSGKDSIAVYLSSKYGYTRFAFGDELKEDFHRRYPEIPHNPKPRIGYQGHGQLMRKLLGEDIWVNKLFDRIAAMEAWEQRKRRIVVSDLRQPNEYDALKSAGYVIIRVTAPEGVRINRAVESGDRFNYADLRHDTESHVASFDVDYEIDNSGSLTDLYTQVDDIMAELHRKGGV